MRTSGVISCIFCVHPCPCELYSIHSCLSLKPLWPLMRTSGNFGHFFPPTFALATSILYLSPQPFRSLMRTSDFYNLWKHLSELSHQIMYVYTDSLHWYTSQVGSCFSTEPQLYFLYYTCVCTDSLPSYASYLCFLFPFFKSTFVHLRCVVFSKEQLSFMLYVFGASAQTLFPHVHLTWVFSCFRAP